MGAMMLRAGTGSFRVKAAMGRVAQALGIEELEAQVSLTEIVATTRAHGSFRTQVVEVGAPAVNTDRIGRLLRISLRAAPGLTAAELQRQLAQVRRMKPLYRPIGVVGGAALASLGFAFVNGGRAQEVILAAVAAAIGKFAQITLKRTRTNDLAVVSIAAGVASATYVALAQLVAYFSPLGIQPAYEAAFTSAILFLVPGFPLLTAALDLARFDFTSGVSRLLYASLVTMAAAIGAWIVTLTFSFEPVATTPPTIPAATLFVLRALASFCGVLGFAITFNTPIKVALTAATVGMIANVFRLTSADHGANLLLVSALATVFVGLSASYISQHWLIAPRITLSVPPVLIMIPGTPTYRALVGLIGRDPTAVFNNGSQALAIVLALASGLAVGRMMTDPLWSAPNPEWTHMPATNAQRALRVEQRLAEKAAREADENDAREVLEAERNLAGNAGKRKKAAHKKS